MNKAVSVIVPAYNQARFLPEALESVLAQKYANWECIIVNDGSSDNTEQVALSYTAKDKRFRYLFKENGGLSSARNEGLKISTGQFIQFLDADDFLHPDKLLSAIEAIAENPQCELVICNYKYQNDLNRAHLVKYDINRKIDLQAILTEWDITFTIPIHCGLIKKTLIPLFNEKLKAKEDWLMWIEVFSAISSYKFIDKEYAFYRLHNQSLTKDHLMMEENIFSAYPYIYEKIKSEELKKMFFERCINHAKDLLKSKNRSMQLLNNSSTFKIGNILLFPIKELKKMVSGLSALFTSGKAK
ncbi:MAG: glycosyltransferase family 2 protein [Mucilaginibacter sp.]|nr:glycosyltransferase family 2 protein [Mucilaginibacter sp.]